MDLICRRETYDRTLEDIFAVQDDIAAQVVKALEVTHWGVAPIPTPSWHD